MQIPVKEIEKRMIIHDGDEKAIIDETWPDQGKGLGIVIKGQKVEDGSPYFRRFLDPDMMIECVGRNM